MSYLFAVPCMFAVYMMVGRLGLSRAGFAGLSLLFTVALVEYQWFVSGVDAFIAACLTMAIANASAWFVDTFLLEDVTREALTQQLLDGRRERSFCSRLTHDYAVRPKDSANEVQLINTGKWQELAASINKLGPSERQGFYANLDYSSINEQALQEAINSFPQDADAHILMGHVKLCQAKGLGLNPGAKFDEPVALAIADAFRHFNLALRGTPEDPEALCGLLMAKGFTGLGAGHIRQSLERLLSADPMHLHGVVAAARFLVLSTRQANDFVSVVESAVAGRSDVTLAIAKIIVHAECMAFIENGVNDSQIIADIYKQLHCYKRETEKFGSWQRDISNNVIAYVMQLIGDKEEASKFLEKIHGSTSPYPWQSNSVV